MRYTLFSLFDTGIQVDEEGLCSAKPENSAVDVGRKLHGTITLDAFCGVGGSAIGLARAGKKVITVERDPRRLRMAQHNAHLYGVDDRIIFVNGDVFEVADNYEFDSIYLGRLFVYITS